MQIKVVKRCDGNSHTINVNRSENNNVNVGWLASIDEKISLIAMSVGVGIGFGGVTIMFIMWKRATHWLMVYNKPQPFYGVYRLPR